MQTLYNVLLASSAETLKKIAVNRNIEAAKLIVIKDKRQLCQMLANEISKRESINSILKTCNMRELRLLQVLITKDPSSAIPWRHVLANLVYRNEQSINQTMESC